VNDIVMSTPADDTVFWNWVTAVSSIVAALSGGGVTPPVAMTGKITAGSTAVTVG
jgi:ATP-dependent Lon protease